jgi:hypothetical protein
MSIAPEPLSSASLDSPPVVNQVPQASEEPSLLNALLGGVAQDRQIQLFTLAGRIESIVSSYDDAFDQLPEMLQNSLDAIEQKYGVETEAGRSYTPKISVFFNEEDRSIAVLDNGVGVPEEHFNRVFEPGVSVKKIQNHKNARGHKGAAVVYLQFDHAQFRFDTKIGNFQRSGRLSDGDKWLKELSQAVGEGRSPQEPVYVETSDIHPTLKNYDSGTFVSVSLADDEARNLFDGIFATSETTEKAAAAERRIEYLLRTRTGVGYLLDSAASETLPPSLEALREVHLEIKFKDGSTRTRQVPIGFLHPHLEGGIAVAEILNKGRERTLELLYQPWNSTILRLKNTLKEKVLGLKKNQDIIANYSSFGYFCYGARNTLYEEIQERFCKFSATPSGEEEHFKEYLKTTGINGGFMVAVGGFPNGRLQQFIQRGGSEDKSRTFVVINFNRRYVPDYGRKSLHHDCRGFVNELCKALMAFAAEEKRGYLPSAGRSSGGSAGAAGGLAAARQLCKDEENLLRQRYNGIPPYCSDATSPYFDPQYELDVAYQFLSLVRAGVLKGYRIFGLPTLTMLDGLFDYELSSSNSTEYNVSSNPLGVRFAGKPSINLTGQWLEYKKSADELIADFNSQEGASGKKWYDTVQLLICDKMEGEFEGFEVSEIADGSVNDRVFFGATHLIKKANHEHTIQVIALSKLRSLLGH